MFVLSIKLTVLALTDPMKSASSFFSISKEATSVLQEALQTGEEVSMSEHTTKWQAILRNVIKKDEAHTNTAFAWTL